MNRFGEVSMESLMKVLLWVVAFSIMLLGVYFLLRRVGVLG